MGRSRRTLFARGVLDRGGRGLAGAEELEGIIGIEVDDVEASGKELQKRGMRILMRDPIDANASARWLVHPKDANGVMVESLSGNV